MVLRSASADIIEKFTRRVPILVNVLKGDCRGDFYTWQRGIEHLLINQIKLPQGLKMTIESKLEAAQNTYRIKHYKSIEACKGLA